MSFDFVELTERLERVSSRRVALRQVSLADAWPLFQATRNESFNEHLLWPQPRHEAELLTRLNLITHEARKGRLCAVSAVVKQTGEWISLFRFLPHGRRPGAIEMGLWTHDRFWHGRYSLEIGRLCVAAAFSLSNVHTLIGASAPANRSSCELMRLVGLRPLELVRRPTEMGHEVDLQEFVIERQDWERAHRTRFELFEPAVALRGEAGTAATVAPPGAPAPASPVPSGPLGLSARIDDPVTLP